MLIKSALVASKSSGSPMRVSVMAPRMVSVGTCSLPTMRTSSTMSGSWADAVCGAAPAAATAAMSAKKSKARVQLGCMLLRSPSNQPKRRPGRGAARCRQFVSANFESCRPRPANAASQGKKRASVLRAGAFGRNWFLSELAGPVRLVVPVLRVLRGFPVFRPGDVQVEYLGSEDDVARRPRFHHPAAARMALEPPADADRRLLPQVRHRRGLFGAVVRGFVAGLGLAEIGRAAAVKLGHDFVVALPPHELVDEPLQVVDDADDLLRIVHDVLFGLDG